MCLTIYLNDRRAGDIILKLNIMNERSFCDNLII